MEKIRCENSYEREMTEFYFLELQTKLTGVYLFVADAMTVFSFAMTFLKLLRCTRLEVAVSLTALKFEIK